MDRELIYNRIARAINNSDWDTYVTQRYEPIPETVPCVFIEMVNKTRTRRYADLCNTDEQYRYTFEVQVFHYSITDAYALMEFIEEQFKLISFFEDMCMPIDNANQKIARIVARFTAQVGANAITGETDNTDGGEVQPWNEDDDANGGNMQPWNEADRLDGGTI